jgi:uncharacterized protein
MNRLNESFSTGHAWLSARADLLDRINVFPIADSDTGTNLRISLGPLRVCGNDRKALASRLHRSATGNSGNIAAAFFGELVKATSVDELPAMAALGRQMAWQAIADPRQGTMLNVFDTLAALLAEAPLAESSCRDLLTAMQESVLATATILPDLRAAGVVDAGALGMFVFFDGFFRTLTGCQQERLPLTALFPGRLEIAGAFRQKANAGYCVDALLRPSSDSALNTETIAAMGESVVVVRGEDQLKIHLHTANPRELRQSLDRLGEVITFSDEALPTGAAQQPRVPARPGCLHIITDAAGSLPRDLARDHGITLLDSYIISGDTAQPESLCAPPAIYAQLRAGTRVTTAQASLTERHELYGSICEQYGRTLYLCVGSAFTGNYAAATAWQRQHGKLFEVIDTGAASGRLALIALLTARRSHTAGDAAEVAAYARALADSCRELVFIDTLRYLVAGGRVSRTGGFFGDLLRMKPVITPTRDGVRKLGVVRSREAQLDFALKSLRAETAGHRDLLLLLQYSDNRQWVEETAQPKIRTLLPEAEIELVPLSLTSGVHMGPGTWALAFAPSR